MAANPHSTTESTDELGGNINSPKTRGRACTECRSIKVRCENQHPLLDGPCNRCIRLSLDCVYREKKRGRKPRHTHPYAGDGPSEILLQQGASSALPANPQIPSPNPSTSQTSSYVNSAEHYGDARFDQEYSPVRGPPVSPFTVSSQADLHSSRQSPHFPLQRVEPPLRYPVSGLSVNVETSSGSGSGTSASMDPDRSLKLMGSAKEPHPKNTSASAYSLANLLSDSRPSSPVNGNSGMPDRNLSDDYDDPVTAGIIPPDAVRVLFNFYHESLNPVIALLDPALHTAAYVRARSSVLFTAIL
ncbi:hypothetical protein FRC08_017703, partial [Ceratobasidium sp. 394]